MSRQAFYVSLCENSLSYCDTQPSRHSYVGAASGEQPYCALLLSFFSFVTTQEYLSVSFISSCPMDTTSPCEKKPVMSYKQYASNSKSSICRIMYFPKHLSITVSYSASKSPGFTFFFHTVIVFPTWRSVYLLSRYKKSVLS